MMSHPSDPLQTSTNAPVQRRVTGQDNQALTPTEGPQSTSQSMTAVSLIAQVQANIKPESQTQNRSGAGVLPDPSDRRSAQQPTERMIGRVTFCNGSRATVSTSASNVTEASADFWSVGRLISIDVGKVRVVGLVYEMRTDRPIWEEVGQNAVSVQVELVGEIFEDKFGGTRFHRGVSRYPQVGAIAHKIRAGDLEVMHDLGERASVEVGRLSQNDDIPATVSVEDMLQRHFAVVGTTGVGKSCSLTLLVRQCLEVKPNLRVLLLDPHNEFYSAFGSIAEPLDASTMDLPFWMFKHDEIEDVIFRGKIIEEESEILREIISQAKTLYQSERNGSTTQAVIRKSLDVGGVNVDSPLPYRVSDLFRLIDEFVGHLSPRYERHNLKSLRVRIDNLVNDPRYAFMFVRGGVEDNFAAIITRIFRLQPEGKPVSILNLSGLPSDVTNAVVSVLARLAFDVAYASEGQLHVLLVCEEAHRYVPQDPNAGFIPTRRAIAKIAKEGRKYGCSIAVVTQRPGELDPTILSQCSTVFAMRLANDKDQEIIRSAIADSSASTISFLSALDNREAIVFGEGVATTMRFKFTYQEQVKLPRAAALAAAFPSAGKATGAFSVDRLIQKLRGHHGISEAAPQAWVAAAPAASSLRRPPEPKLAPPPLGNSGFGQSTSVAGTPLGLRRS